MLVNFQDIYWVLIKSKITNLTDDDLLLFS